MSEDEEFFNNSSLNECKVTKFFDSSNFNEDQSISHKLIQEVQLTGRLTSLSSLKESLENLMMDEMTEFPSLHHPKGSIKVFRETALWSLNYQPTQKRFDEGFAWGLRSRRIKFKK